MGRHKAFKEEMRHFQGLVESESMLDSMERGEGTQSCKTIQVGGRSMLEQLKINNYYCIADG